MTKQLLVTVVAAFSVSCQQPNENLAMIDASNPSMLKAMTDARESVATFISALKSPEDNKFYFIKVPLRDGETVEHIWADSVEYTGGTFTAKIANHPQLVPGKKFGDEVSVPKAGISDWAIFSDKGTVLDGGYTTKVLMNR